MNKDYINKYNKDNYKQYIFRVRKNDKTIINKLDEVKNRNSYIRYLVSNDIDIKNKTYTIAELKRIIIPILNSYDIKDIYLFGSYARGEANKDSDIDIYCEKGKIKTFFDQGKMEEKLEKSLNKKVDVIFTSSTMNDYFKTQIMKDLIKLC